MKNVYAIISILILFFLVFLSFYLDHPGFYSGDHGIVYIQAESLLKNSFSSLDVIHNGERFLKGSFQDNDGFMIRIGDSQKVVFPPAFAAISAFFKYFLCRSGLFFIPFLSLIGTAFIIRLFFDRTTPQTLLSFLVIMTTPLLFYGYTLSAHTSATFFAILSAYLCLDNRNISKSIAIRFFLSGLCAGSAVWFRTELYCMILSLFVGIVYISRGSTGLARKLIVFSAGVSAAIIPLWIFNYIAYSHPLGLHIISNISGHGNWVAERKHIASIMLAGFASPLFLSAIAAALIIIVSVSIYPQNSRVRFLATIMAIPIFVFMGRTIASIYYEQEFFMKKGLFWTMPIIALIPFSYATCKREEKRGDQKAPFMLIVATLYIFLVLLTTPTDGGIQWGPRLLLPSLPLLSTGIFISLIHYRPRYMPRLIRDVLFAVLIVAGIAVQYKGLREMKERERYLGNFSTSVNKIIPADSVVITDLWWAEQVLPEMFLGCRMFFVNNPQSAQKLLTILIENNVRDFWLLLAPETKGAVIIRAITSMGIEKDIRIISQEPAGYRGLMIVHLMY